MGDSIGFNQFMAFYVAWVVIEFAISIVRSVFISKVQRAYFAIFGKDTKKYNEFYKKHPIGSKATLLGYLALIPAGILLLSLFLLFGKASVGYTTFLVVLLFALIAETSLEIARAVLDIIYANKVVSDIESGKLKNEDASVASTPEATGTTAPVQGPAPAQPKSTAPTPVSKPEPEKASEAPKPQFCSECGATIKGDSVFCEGCGKKLK